MSKQLTDFTEGIKILSKFSTALYPLDADQNKILFLVDEDKEISPGIITTLEHLGWYKNVEDSFFYFYT